jgi:hypothetical protein
MVALSSPRKSYLARQLQACRGLPELGRAGEGTDRLPSASQRRDQLLPLEVNMELAEAEAKDLTLHVALCAQRHDEVQKRLKRLEMIGVSILFVLITGGWISVNELRHLAVIAGIPALPAYSAPQR